MVEPKVKEEKVNFGMKELKITLEQSVEKLRYDAWS